MNVKTALVNQQHCASTQLVPTSASAHQALLLTTLASANPQTSAAVTLNVQPLLPATTESARTLVKSPDHVEQMLFAPRSITGQCAPVRPVPRATPMSAVFPWSVSATLSVAPTEPVSGTSVLMCAACPMFAVRTPTAGPPTMSPAASVNQASPETQPLAVPSCSCVLLKSSVQQVCCAALVSVPRPVSPPESVWTTRSVLVAVVSQSARTPPSARSFTPARTGSVSRSLDVPTMKSVISKTPVSAVRTDSLSVKMSAVVPSFVDVTPYALRNRTRPCVPALMGSMETRTTRRLAARRSSAE